MEGGFSRMGFQVTEVQERLKGFDYPASPDQLARHAENHGADDDLVVALRSLNKDNFDGTNAVMHGLSEADALIGSTS